MMKAVILFVVISATVRKISVLSDGDAIDRCSKNRCVNKAFKKLNKLEEITVLQEELIASLANELTGIKDKIADLNNAESSNQKSAQGKTYIRWGRTTCPGDAQLVYDGYAAGGHYTHGTAANTLCLPTNPDFDQYTAGFQTAGRIYGAEYETISYSSWKYLHDHEVPCAVCRIPRNDVLMVPGKNVCHENYNLEYKGYLMAGYHGHKSSEFVCVDDKPEVLNGNAGDSNGKLFYFVEAGCGSLKCPPYVNGQELTCAVCSFSPNEGSRGL